MFLLQIDALPTSQPSAPTVDLSTLEPDSSSNRPLHIPSSQIPSISTSSESARPPESLTASQPQIASSQELRSTVPSSNAQATKPLQMPPGLAGFNLLEKLKGNTRPPVAPIPAVPNPQNQPTPAPASILQATQKALPRNNSGVSTEHIFYSHNFKIARMCLHHPKYLRKMVVDVAWSFY